VPQDEPASPHSPGRRTIGQAILPMRLADPIRTGDLLLPKQALYQTELQPVKTAQIVGLARLELATSRSPSVRATKLRHSPPPASHMTRACALRVPALTVQILTSPVLALLTPRRQPRPQPLNHSASTPLRAH
jgi:hypothetical protein